ncbi:MAG: histidine kinase [Lachnospiraceae bacterium]|nr:histidine kinase [Lachnospiraceae bacterium]
MNRQEKRRAGGLQRKLRITIFTTVLITITLIFSVVAYYYMGMYRERRMADISEQMDLMSSEILFFQSLMDNVSKQAITDVAVRDSLDSRDETTGIYLYKKRRANESLAAYAHVVEPVHELLIYSAEGETYSSLYSVRSPFKPEDNPWYTEYKDKNLTSGFTSIHNSAVITGGHTEDVISYVMTFYNVEKPTEIEGDLIINIKLSYLESLLSTSNELVASVVLYDSSGRIIYASNDDIVPYEKISEASKDRSVLVSSNLKDGWVLAMKISDETIQYEIRALLIRIALAFALAGILTYIMLARFVSRIVKPINVLADSVNEVGKGNFDVNVEIHSQDEIEDLADGFNNMVRDIKDLMEESVENEKIKRKMTVDKLMNQINPHFIYNTLNSIVYMAKLDGNERIVSFTNTFISLLQGTLKIQDSAYITVGEEIENIENYLTLQKFRYADKFESEIICEEKDVKALIPCVMMEPIVENAIFHGIAPNDEKGHLTVKIEREEDLLSITVEDDGIGMDEETIEKLLSDTTSERGAIHKIGIANVRKRIKQIYGEEFDIIIESAPGAGSRVLIKVPYMT